MAGIQPYRYPEGTYMPGDSRAANLALAYRYPVSNMAAGIRQHFWHPEASLPSPQAANNMAVPAQPYSTGAMNYYYPRLEIGTTEPVLITQVLAPHCFSCQLRSMAHEAQRLLDSMQHYYQVQKGYGEQVSPPALAAGQPCASMGADGRWYRSLLQGIFADKPLATVIHVDWGGREIVPLSGLRYLAEEFLRLPVVTFPCALYGIANGGLDWDQRLVAEFCTLLHGKQVNAKVECFNSYERLYFVTLFSEDGTDLNHHFKTRSQNPTITMPEVTEPPEDDGKKILSEQTSYVSKFPPVELKTSKFYDAEVVFVIDPFSFWVRLKMYAAEHKEMVDGMTTLYSQASKLEGIISAPKPGQLCCARYEDLYCRAEVISVDERKQVKVYFLDNGFLETVDWYNIKELPTKFTKLQALAVKCCIADTYPLEDTWSQEATRTFKIAVTDRHLVIHVILRDADEYTIDIQDQSRIEERCIGKILANAGLARFEELDSVDSQSNSEKIALIESTKAALRPSATDYIPKIQEEAAAASYPCEDNTETLQFSPFEDQLFEPGTTIEVVVSYIENPGFFWCQNARSRADLCTLMDAIQKQCTSAGCPYTSDTLACLAKSPKDDVWYRAFINEIPVNISKTTTVDVLYVDYGIRETVPLTNLRALNSEFFHLKAQAFKCSLYNIITPKGKNPFTWDNEATKVFSQFVQKASKWTEFQCIFYATASLDNEVFNIVDLYTPFASVCDELVQSGYATHLHHKTLAPSVKLLTYYYSKHDLKLGDKEEIYITYADSPLLFYLQLARSSSTIDRISATITKVIDKTPKIKLLPKCGSLCLAKFSDQQWYRGMQSEDGSNEIFFVDYGNTEKLSKDCILPIMSSEHSILLVPVQAIKCSLSDIPSDVPGRIVSWFKNAVLDKPLKALFVAKDADGKLSIDLFDGDQKINETLKSKLGLRVQKEKNDYPPPARPTTAKQEDSRKPPDNTGNQEKKTSFTLEKSIKSRDFDVRSLSDRRGSDSRSYSDMRGSSSRSHSDTRGSDSQSNSVTRGSDSRSHSITRGSDSRSHSDTRGSDSRSHSDRRGYDSRSHLDSRGSDSRSHSDTRGSDSRSHSDTRGSDSRSHSDTRGSDSRSHSDTRGSDSRSHLDTRGSDSRSHSVTRGSDSRSHSAMTQEPETIYKKNPTFPYKAENKDSNSCQESSFQRKTETIQRFPDFKQGGNKSLPQRQSSTLATERPSAAKPPVVVTLSDIPQRKIIHGMKETVYVSHINSVFDFYVQVAEDGKLEEMSEILNNKKDSLEELRDEDISPGNVICAYFPDDGQYYRGVVTGKSRQGLCIQYIDYGNTSVTSDCKNYSLPQKCCAFPAMSIYCSLDKPNSASSSPNLKEALTKFSERTSDVHLDCEFRKQDGQKWEVILKDELGCLNDLLSAPEEPVYEEKVTKIVKEAETPCVGAFSWNLPQPGATVKVYASAVDGPECFWCQLSTADIDSLASQVQEAGEKSVGCNDFITALQVGSPCNVIFSEDNNWYRAVVTKMEADVVTVRFIDYGNEDSVGQDQLRQLPEPLVKIAPQAFSCCLADSDMKAETWTSEGRNYFYEKVTEDVLELTICEIQGGDKSRIPVARVTIKCNGLDINEEVRKFLQGAESKDLKVPDESTNSRPEDLLDENQETDQPQGYGDSLTADVRANEPEESALESQYDEDCPLQEVEKEDNACSHLDEEQESGADGVKEAVDLHQKEHNDLAVEDLKQAPLKDQVQQDEFEVTPESKITMVPGGYEDCTEFEEFEDCSEGPCEENNGTTDDMSPVHVPREQGGSIESDQPEPAAYQQCPDLMSSRQQDLLSRDTSASLESLIIYFNDKLILLNEERTSHDAATKEVTTESEETNVPEAESAEEFVDCTEDEAKQENEGDDVPSEDYVEMEDSMGSEALEASHFAESDDLHRAGWPVPSIMSQEGNILATIEVADEMVPSVIREDVHKIENIVTNEDVEATETIIATEGNEDYKDAMAGENVADDDIVDSLVSAELVDLEPEKDAAIIEVGSYGGLVISKDDLIPEIPLDSEAVSKGEEDHEDCMDIDVICAEDLSLADDTVTCKVDIEYVRTLTSNDFIQSEEDLTSCDIIECGAARATHTEDTYIGEEIQKDEEVESTEGAVGGASISFQKFEAILVEGPSIDLSQKCVASAGEEPADDKDIDVKDDMNCEEPVVGGDLELEDSVDHEEPIDGKNKDNMNHEESVTGEDKELLYCMKSEEGAPCEDVEEVVALEEVFSTSADFNDLEEPETIQGFVETVEDDSSQDVEHLGTVTSEDFVPSKGELTGSNITECGAAVTTDIAEIILDEELASTERTIREVDLSDPELVEEFRESRQHSVDSVRGGCDPNEETLPADETNTRLPEREQEQASAEFTAEDVLEPISEHVTSEGHDETKQEREENEGVYVPSEDYVEMEDSMGSEALEASHFAESDDLHRAGWPVPSIMSQEGNILAAIEVADEMVPSVIIEDVHKIENIVTNEDVEATEAMLATEGNEDYKEAMAGENVADDDIVDSLVSAELVDIEPEKDAAIIEVGSYGGLVISEDDLIPEIPLDSEAVTEGEEDREDCMDIDVICAEDLSLEDDLVTGKVAIENVRTLTSNDFIQSEEDLTSCDIIECGAATTTHSEDTYIEEEIQKDEEVESTEGAVGGASLSFQKFEAILVEGPSIDFSQKCVASAGEEPADDKDIDVKDDMNCEEPRAGGDLELEDSVDHEEPIDGKNKDNMNHEESVTGEDKELLYCMKSEEGAACEDVEEVVALEEVFCTSADLNDLEEPETIQGFVETVEDDSSQHVQRLGTVTSEDFVPSKGELTGSNITECGAATTTDIAEIILEDEDLVSTERTIREVSSSFEEFEATVVEGLFFDLSPDFVAGAGERAKNLEFKHSMKSDEEFVAGEDTEIGAPALADIFWESLSSGDISVPELAEEVVMESSQHSMDCVSGDPSEETLPTDDANTRLSEREQEQTLAEVMADDVLEPTCEDGTLEGHDSQSGSFTEYRESPLLIASTESELSDPLDEIDSDSEASEAQDSVETELSSCPGGRKMSRTP